MSRTNENKLKMKDIATIGIFSALLFVVTMVAGALMGISMVLNMIRYNKIDYFTYILSGSLIKISRLKFFVFQKRNSSQVGQ